MIILSALAASALAAAAQPRPEAPIRLARGSIIQAEMGAADVRDMTLAMRAGESAELIVDQQGIDVVVELFGPGGALLDSVDSPNGRQGPEPVSLVAREGGIYRLRVRSIAANEPRGRIGIRVLALRSVAATGRLLAERRRLRDAAAAWLGRRNVPVPPDGRLDPGVSLPPFDALAADATIIGLGEATHGSREFNDFRLGLVQRLVTRHGFRLIALEDSASRWRALEDYVAGRTQTPATEIEWGWIGRRARAQLLEWVREWNVRHPADQVRVIGVDAQDNGRDRDLLGAFLGRAYGPAVAAAWMEQAAEIAAADAQTAVFGDSGTSLALRQFMHEILAQLSSDAALLRARLGDQAYGAALAAATTLAAFVDFNAGRGPLSHSRDWHMAAALARAISLGPNPTKAVYWGHNSHVSTEATSWGPTGAILRQTFGCGYRAIGTTFGAGDFIAQVPNDPTDRLAAISVAAAGDDTIETALATVRPGAHLSSWQCGDGATGIPEWLGAERRMRWIGGLYAPDSAPSAAYRAYRLPMAFDAIGYFPRVTAEPIPAGRPVVPPRQRP